MPRRLDDEEEYLPSDASHDDDDAGWNANLGAEERAAAQQLFGSQEGPSYENSPDLANVSRAELDRQDVRIDAHVAGEDDVNWEAAEEVAAAAAREEAALDEDRQRVLDLLTDSDDDHVDQEGADAEHEIQQGENEVEQADAVHHDASQVRLVLGGGVRPFVVSCGRTVPQWLRGSRHLLPRRVGATPTHAFRHSLRALCCLLCARRAVTCRSITSSPRPRSWATCTATQTERSRFVDACTTTF